VTTFTPEFMLQLLASVCSAAAVGIGVYSGIKSDLAVNHERAKGALESANLAHRRIDDILQKD